MLLPPQVVLMMPIGTPTVGRKCLTKKYATALNVPTCSRSAGTQEPPAQSSCDAPGEGWARALAASATMAVANQAKLKRIAPPGRCRRLDSPIGDHRIVSPYHLINFRPTCNGSAKSGSRPCGRAAVRSQRLRHSEGPLIGRRMLLAILVLIAASGTSAAQAQATGRV